MCTSTIIASSGWPSAVAIDSELCQSASRSARQAALVGSAPRMSVPMPISSTMRFFAIASSSRVKVRNSLLSDPPQPRDHFAARFSANEARPSAASGVWRLAAWLSTSPSNVARRSRPRRSAESAPWSRPWRRDRSPAGGRPSPRRRPQGHQRHHHVGETDARAPRRRRSARRSARSGAAAARRWRR